MTASTAPITLPAQHRQPAPTWWFHIAVAWITYLLALTSWALAAVRLRGRRHLVALAAAAVLVAIAAAGLLWP